MTYIGDSRDLFELLGRALRARRFAVGLRGAAFAVLGLQALSACSGNKDKFAYVERPVEIIYNEAVDKMEKRRYREAVELFDEVERQHPYSAWARRAMLMSAFASYQSNKYEDAINSIDRFIALHPGNRDVGYAYYLKAASYYEQIRDVGRDQDYTQNALNALNEVVRRFPSSEYARDARLKIDMTRDHLAGKEMYVGRYYLRRGQHIAAINRFRNVIEKYQTTTHTPEALHRLVEAYLELGIEEEAQIAAAVLGHNYPGERWYQDSYRMMQGRGVKPIEVDENGDVEGGGFWLTRPSTSIF